MQQCIFCRDGKLQLFVLTSLFLSISLAGGQGPLINATEQFITCSKPRPCDQFLSEDLPCVKLPYTRAYDITLDMDICAAVNVAHNDDPTYMPSTGMATSRCIADWKGDGRCDLSNNHALENCEYDGGDCCLSTCHTNCANEPDLYERSSDVCEYFCGEQALYLCLDDSSVLSPVTQWCAFGQIQAMSKCYVSKLEVAAALLECILDDRSHGNEINAGPQCGNATLTCTMSDVIAQNGCHLTKDECFSRPCCDEAIKYGFIERNPQHLPTLSDVYNKCENSLTENDEPCFAAMVKCITENRAAKGGCCNCDTGWSGWRCRWPLCWPKCVHGTCISPNLCYCEEGWKGAACSHPICEPECVPGQGTCVEPNKCSCFYGWTGPSCELPTSVPACVNGDAVAPDICRCADGWGGRLCDYPLCQSWPTPSPECAHGTCVEPYTCECEPGWQIFRPINKTGFDILPFWSKGQDISQETSGTYVKADSRIAFLSFWDRQYNSSNAAKCTVPICRDILDPRCTECTPPPNAICKMCEPGFFVNTSIQRCERCSNVFPHCMLCGPEPTGPDGKVVLRCRHCDPLYVLEPVPYGEDPSGRCVSDGPIEFSSPVYHVYKDQRNVTLVIQRSIYALRPEFARPITVVVRTRDATAHSSSMIYGGQGVGINGGGLANFEFTVANITFDVDTDVWMSAEGSMGDNFSEALQKRFRQRIELPIKIYDDVSYHNGMRYFDVELILPPEHLTGHQGPLYPFIPPRLHETDQAWLMPQNFYRGPLLDRQDVLSTARVYIWDHREATAANTSCEGSCLNWQAQTLVGRPRNVRILAKTHQGAAITAPTTIRRHPHFIIKFLPRRVGMEEAIGSVSTARQTGVSGLYLGSFNPNIAGKYKLLIEKAVPGIYAQYWWHRNVHRNSPQQPDISRVDHVLDFYWPDVATAPAFVRWQFILHFECIRSEKFPFNFGHALGVRSSPGTKMKVNFWNDGAVMRNVPDDQTMKSREQIIREDCDVDVPFFICIDLLFHDPVVDPFGFYAFQVEFTTQMVDELNSGIPAYIEIMLYHQNDDNVWGWWPIDQKCLLTSGLNIRGSPFEDFKAISGAAVPQFSEVNSWPDMLPRHEVVVDIRAYARIDLRDILGAPVTVGGPLLRSISATLMTLDGQIDQVVKIEWQSASRFYRASWMPQPPPKELGDDLSSGRYYRNLVVTLDGTDIQHSPMPVTVIMAVSDPRHSFIMAGNYTPAQAGRRAWFQIRSATVTKRERVTGGDKYEILFEGPRHDPLPKDGRFLGEATDDGNGSYTCTYEIQRPGRYNMRIYLNGEEIGISPFTDVLVWDYRSADLSTADGPGVTPPPGAHASSPAQITAGVPTTFDIITRDTYEVQYFRGNASIDFYMPVMKVNQTSQTSDSTQGASSRGFVPPPDYLLVTDHSDGTYTVDYSVCKAGLTYLDIQLYNIRDDFRPIKGSAFPVQVGSGVLVAEASKVHAPPTTPSSGVAAFLKLELRDACGNVADERAMERLNVSLQRVGPPITYLPVEIQRTNPGEVVVFFTPGRRGLHRMTVLGDLQDFQDSPLEFEVVPTPAVPSGLTPEWVLGSIGASAQSTFEVFNSPTHAGEPARIRITSRDVWGDPLFFENDTFLVNMWRESGPCPSPTRCMSFSYSEDLCDRLPSCKFDLRNAECRPSCPTPPSPAAFTLVDPEATTTIKSVEGEVYEVAVFSTVAGIYHCTVSTLRPGGFYAHWYNNDLQSKRVFTEMLRGPLDYNWGLFGPGEMLPSNRFSLRVVGWIRIPVQERYTFHLNSDTGGRIFLNDTEVSPPNSSGIDLNHDTIVVDVDLRAGFVPIMVEYEHWPGEVQRGIGAYLRLSFGAASVPFQVLQAESMYYEEPVEQVYNPFVHEVKPSARAKGLASLGGELASPKTATAGKPLSIRMHNLDSYGNLQTRFDPTAFLRISSNPPDVSALGYMADTLHALHWRVVPLHNGAWDIVMLPEGPAPGTHNLTFELYSNDADIGNTRPMATRTLQMILSAGLPHKERSGLLCLPPSPWVAGVQVTCVVVPRDIEGNEVRGLQDVSLFATPPAPHPQELTEKLPSGDKSDVARQFRFVPRTTGNWTLHAEILLELNHTIVLSEYSFLVVPGFTSATESGSLTVMPETIVTGIPFELSFEARDDYGNPVDTGHDLYRLHYTGGYEESLAMSPPVTLLSSNVYAAETTTIPNRSFFELVAEMLSLRHNNSLSQCPEISPVPGGQVSRLTGQRAIDSLAILRCLPGFQQAGGTGSLRCEWPKEDDVDVDKPGYAEWHDLRSLPASGLLCKPQTLWCPVQPAVANAKRLRRDWQREVGSTNLFECLPGHSLLFGDLETICGSRNGSGAWLSLDGTVAIDAICVPTQNFCPELSPILARISYASAGRDAGSVVRMECEQGSIPKAGDAHVVCGGDGVWKKPYQATPMTPSSTLECELDPNFCPEPDSLMGEGVQVKGLVDRRLGGKVTWECARGYETSGIGETTAVCAVSQTDDRIGRWMSGDDATKGQAELQPLRCRLQQDWCPPVQVDKGEVLSYSKERYLGSVVTLGCVEGYEAKSGKSRYACMLDSSRRNAGIWVDDDGRNIALHLMIKCGLIQDYCKMPAPGEGSDFSLTDGLQMDSRISFSCQLAYEPDVPLEFPAELFCRPSSTPGRGTWTYRDGLEVEPASYLQCRKSYNWCPRLGLVDGKISGLIGERRLGSTANLTCDAGLQMKFGGEVLGQITLPTICSAGTIDGGIWVTDYGQEPGTVTLPEVYGQVECIPLENFCPPLEAYTIIMGIYQKMDDVTRSRTYDDPKRSYRSTARIHCREDRLMFHSYGDSEVVCGLSANGSVGAWRSHRGMLAITKHCFFTGSPILDTAHIENGCFFGDFQPGRVNYSVPAFFKRRGSILFWHKPTAWEIDSVLIEGTHGEGKWTVKVVDEGILNARVDEGVGDVTIDMTHNGTKGLNEWYHIAFVWDLGVGLAGLGQLYFYIDGELADSTGLDRMGRGTKRLDHFTWVDPEDKLYIGGILSPSSPGDYSNVRIYTRATPEEEVTVVRSSEDPTCGMNDDVCPTPWMSRAYTRLVDNPNDIRYALFPRRPAAEVTLSCDPGYAPLDGDRNIICTASGVWLRHGSDELARPLRCCRNEPNYCPDIDISSLPGAVITATGYQDTLACEAFDSVVDDGGQGDHDMGVMYDNCPELESPPDSTISLSSGLNFSSEATLHCNPGYEPAEMTMDTLLICSQGRFDPKEHALDSRVQGRWLTADGREPSSFACRGLQNTCPDPRLPNTFIVHLSDQRRTGSFVELGCLAAFKVNQVKKGANAQIAMGDKGSGAGTNSTEQMDQLNSTHTDQPLDPDIAVIAVCRYDDVTGSGVWVVPDFDKPLDEFSPCEPLQDFCPEEVLIAMTGWRDKLQPLPKDSFAISSPPSRLGDTADLRCKEPYIYSYGDEKVTCGGSVMARNGSLHGVGDYPAIPLHCRDTSPTVRDSAWYRNTCGVGASSAMLAWPLLGPPEGAVALWWQVPNQSFDALVLWAAVDESCWQDEESSGPSASGLVNLTEGSRSTTDSSDNSTSTTPPTNFSGDVTELAMTSDDDNLTESDNGTFDSDDSDNTTDVAPTVARRLSSNDSDDGSESMNESVNETVEAVKDKDNENDENHLVGNATNMTSHRGKEDGAKCLLPQHMIIDDGWLHVQLEEETGKFEVKLTELGLDVQDWLHLAYTWSDRGVLADLWLNGLSVRGGFGDLNNESNDTKAIEDTFGFRNDSDLFLEEDDSLDENVTDEEYTNDTEGDQSEIADHADKKPRKVTGIAALPHRRRLEKMIDRALAHGWIKVPGETDLPLEENTSFQLYMGWPISTPNYDEDTANAGRRTLHRVYQRSLSDADVSAMVAFEKPYCPEVFCPELVSIQEQAGLLLLNSFVEYATGPSHDPSVPPFSRIPDSSFHLRCFPGFLPSAGNKTLVCGSEGAWDGDPLECCAFEQDFCGEVPLDIKHTPETEEVLHDLPEPEDTGNMSGAAFGLALEDIFLPVEACSSRTSSPGSRRSLGARIGFKCPVAFVLVGGSSEIQCQAVDGRGTWLDYLSGGEMVSPVCELNDHWCPLIQAGDNAYLVNATIGRRLGSSAYFRCLDDTMFYPDTGSITVRCLTNSEGNGGFWADAFGNPTAMLSCAEKVIVTTQTTTTTPPPTSAGIISGLPGDQGIPAVLLHAANASLGCGFPFLHIHGDDTAFCVLGPSITSIDGTDGRWVDNTGANLELPLCVFRIDWCPKIEIEGFHSEVANLSTGYEYASIATLRCHLGYQRIAGNITLNCVNHESLLWGEWDAAPLQCDLAPYFCPPPKAENAFITSSDPLYTFGSTASFECHPGFVYLEGDLDVQCNVSDGGSAGDWKLADGSRSKTVKCVPLQTYCQVPEVAHGYVNSLTSEGRLGSVMQMNCFEGFKDPRTGMHERTAICNQQTATVGEFQIGLSHSSEDVYRAASLVRDILEVLEQYDSLDYRSDDSHWQARLQFEERWRRELGDSLRGLYADSSVKSVLEKLPNYDGVTSQYLAGFTTDHVRMLSRLLESKGEELHDMSTEEARLTYGAFDQLKISFQAGNTVPPVGWLLDAGELFAQRGNGFTYGWKCDVSMDEVNGGAVNRNRHLYSLLENTLVATDPLSRCNGQEWKIELPQGTYSVEVTVQDTEHWSRSNGCLLQGKNLDFPEKVGPPGTLTRRKQLVNITSSLTISADEDYGCSTINRVTIQAVKNLSAGTLQPMLQCSRTEGWCQVPQPPPNSHVVTPTGQAFALGDEIEYACNNHYVYEYGLRRWMCGSAAGGRSSQWRGLEGGQDAPNITCVVDRQVCPTPPALIGAAITDVNTRHYCLGSEITMECRRGYQRKSGAAYARCEESTGWCTGTRGSCSTPAAWLECEPVREYCPSRLASKEGGPGISSLEANITAGLEGANEESSHTFIRVSQILALPSGVFGDVVHLSCPPHHKRVTGDMRVVCGHGPGDRGEWQRARGDTVQYSDSSQPDEIVQLIDEATAEPVVCELDTTYGVRRKYYTRINGLFDEQPETGLDVVPNIDQFTSAYDAAHFEAYLHPAESGDYTLSVEAIGSFVLSLNNKVLLKEQSTGMKPELFSGQLQRLKSSNYYAISLQYWVDPRLPERDDPDDRQLHRHVRLMWSRPGQATATVIPPTELHHSFDPLHGFPMKLRSVNDPSPCVSWKFQTISGLETNDTGIIADGTAGLNYNQDLNCQWELIADFSVRFNIYANYFGVEETAECIGDRLEIRAGIGSVMNTLASLCGTYPEGQLVASAVARKLELYFITDAEGEAEGFNITWKIADAKSDVPGGLSVPR